MSEQIAQIRPYTQEEYMQICQEGYQDLRKISKQHRIDLALCVTGLYAGNHTTHWVFNLKDSLEQNAGRNLITVCTMRAYKKYPRTLSPETMEAAYLNYLTNWEKIKDHFL